jgi:hypothetical protein
MNRKAALELSTGFIVVAAIGIIILVSAIFFISSQFQTISGSATQIQQEIKEQLMEDLISSNEKLVLLQNNINLDYGKDENIIFGVHNNLDTELVYGINIEITQKEQAGDKDFSGDLGLLYYKGPFFIEKGQSGINLVKIDGKKKGVYLVKITIKNKNDDEETYAQKSFFVEVN